MKKLLWILVSIIVVAGIVAGYELVHHHKKTIVVQTSQWKTNVAPKSVAQPSSSFNKNLYSLTNPTSIWVVVNKQHPINPINYVPADLVVPNVPLRVPGNETMQMSSVAATALEQMFAAAKTQGINLMLASGYRSYSYQVSLYNGYVQNMGQAAADQQSARPGYSEHQTGFAADVEPVSRTCELEQCFGTTPEGEWVTANAYKYGFIVRYTTGDESITGYEAEPWHIRYIGTVLSNELHTTGINTLEQFFNVAGGTTYKAPPST